MWAAFTARHQQNCNQLIFRHCSLFSDHNLPEIFPCSDWWKSGSSPFFPSLHLGLGSPSLNIPPLLTEETWLPVQVSWQAIGDASRLKMVGLEGTHPYHIPNFGQHLLPVIGECVSPGPYPLSSPSLPLSFPLLSCQDEPSYPQTLVKWPGCVIVHLFMTSHFPFSLHFPPLYPTSSHSFHISHAYVPQQDNETR